jgi:hypothetical protein
VVENLQPCSEETLWRGLWPRAVHRGAFYYTIAVKPAHGQSQRRAEELQLYSGVCTILLSGKFPKNVSQLLQEAMSMEQQWCGNTQISLPPQKVQHLNILKNYDTKMISESRTLHFVQIVGCEIHEHKGCKIR